MTHSPITERVVARQADDLVRAKSALSGAGAASSERRSLGLLEWGRTHLPKHFAKPPSGMHRWLARELDAMGRGRGVRVNLIGPRGGAKSTIGSLAAVVRAAVEGDEAYIWIVSDTESQAHAHLDNVKTELQSNPGLAEAYPHATGEPRRWRAGAIELRNGVVIEAYGSGQRVRGRRAGASRPTFIVCDDVENERQIASAHARQVSRDWFHGTLLKAGTPRTNVINLATALHREAIALSLHNAPGWRSGLFRAVESWPANEELWREWEAIYCDLTREDSAADAMGFYLQNKEAMDQGAAVLWPEEEDLYTLMRMRVDSGATAFEREKQGQPVDPERCEWPESYFDEHIWFDHWPRPLSVRVVTLDPSKGADARHGDYSALVMLGVDGDGVLHVEADLERRPTPQMVADGVEHCLRFHPHTLGVESNQWQQLLAAEFTSEFARRGAVGVAPCEIHNHVSKALRIRRLGPYLSQRRLRFKRGSPSTRLLVDQLRDFPLAAHDDGPDALEMAVRLAGDVWRSRGEGMD